MNVSGRVLTDTEVDRNDRNQQVELQAQAIGNLPTADLRTALRATVRQNGREDNACVLFPPTAVLPGRIVRWEHAQQLIFPAETCTEVSNNSTCALPARESKHSIGTRRIIMPHCSPTKCGETISCAKIATGRP